MEKLIKTFDYTDTYQVGINNVDLTCKVLIYKKERKFLWFNLKPKYTIDVHIPYIKRPFYDGEFATNNRLHCIRTQLVAGAKQYIAENCN